ncbi:hypothetical protein HZS_3937 [Henneguya salminicola]|nr:hypothetical protein HZS_3937 [Henneguya salminicola]
MPCFSILQDFRIKLAQEGLLRKYNFDTEFALAARKIIPIAFVACEELESAFEALSQEALLDLQPILDWFEDNSMGRLKRQGTRRHAEFPPQVWSVYKRVADGNSRTNNHAEAAHRRMQVEFGKDHPTI